MNTQPTLYSWRLGEIDGIGTMEAILETFHPERHGGQWMVEISTGLIVLEIGEVESRGEVK